MESFLPGAASLSNAIDKRLLVVLRDGRKLTGILRSYDQFANLVLQDTVERIFVGRQYGDIPRGVYLIRGENVLLLGEIDERKEEVSDLVEAPIEDILVLQTNEIDLKGKLQQRRYELLRKRGLVPVSTRRLGTNLDGYQ